MRKINKTEPIASFQRFVHANPTANWTSFHDLAKDVYIETRDHILLEEQDCLCGYTELPIEDVTEPDLEPILRDKVEKTVAVFNLKHPSLIERRKTIIEQIRDYSDGMLDLETIKDVLSSSGFRSLVEQYCDEEKYPPQ